MSNYLYISNPHEIGSGDWAIGVLKSGKGVFNLVYARWWFGKKQPNLRISGPAFWDMRMRTWENFVKRIIAFSKKVKAPEIKKENLEELRGSLTWK